MSGIIQTFATHEDAIAEALRDAPPGDIIEIHDADCEGQEEPEEPHDVIGCTCQPMVFAVGAEA